MTLPVRYRGKDARRVQDLECIRNLLRANAATLDISEVRRYFALFDRESLLDELLAALTSRDRHPPPR